MPQGQTGSDPGTQRHRPPGSSWAADRKGDMRDMTDLGSRQDLGSGSFMTRIASADLCVCFADPQRRLI